MSGKEKKGRTRVRLPLPKKKGGPMGPQKGEKGRDRKRERAEIEREIEDSGGIVQDE